MRLIDADALQVKHGVNCGSNYGGLRAIVFKRDIDKAQTIDAVPVVRCKDCKHYNAGFECLIEGYGIERPKDWFCADGERKEDITPLKTSVKSGISFQ